MPHNRLWNVVIPTALFLVAMLLGAYMFHLLFIGRPESELGRPSILLGIVCVAFKYGRYRAHLD